MKTLIVIPTYNEAKNIKKIVKEILTLNLGAKILIVDDNSPDGTGEIAENLAKEHQEVMVIHRPQKLGIGTAYKEAFQKFLNDYDFFIEMDADFSHNPKILPIFLEEIKNQDLVIGSRYIKGGKMAIPSLWRCLVSRIGCLYARLVTGVNINDLTAGYICYSQKALKSINFNQINSGGYAFQIEMKYLLAKQGCKIKEIPIVFTERESGKSKFFLGLILEAIWRCWKLRFFS